VGEWVTASGTSGSGVQHRAFESFGVRVRVSVDGPDLLERVATLLPPNAKPCPLESTTESFGILSEGNGTYRFERGDSPVSHGVSLEFALSLIERQFWTYVGLNAPGKIFVQAGVVEREGHALVLPGPSFSGKSTLVAALVRGGARYYSQEFAVIDEAGLVHPFPTPILTPDSERSNGWHELRAQSGLTSPPPVPVGAVLFTEYRRGAEWRPRSMSPGRGVLAMLDHALRSPERSGDALHVLRRALEGATLLEGERGEASELVGPLLKASLHKLAEAVVVECGC
jgi:hypothetical protein